MRRGSAARHRGCVRPPRHDRRLPARPLRHTLGSGRSAGRSPARHRPPIPEDYFIPGRFAGKTVIVTGCARGMGRVAAIRLAREGANVVGVDWLEDEGQAVIDAIVAEGGKAVFVDGDISENAVCDAMVKTAVDDFGGLDCALNNAGVMDAIFPGDPIDYAKQKDLVMAPHRRGVATPTGTWSCASTSPASSAPCAPNSARC